MRADGPPPSPDGSPVRFGIQDARGQVHAGTLRADGRWAFDFALAARPGPDPERPVFTGAFASGPPGERFVYLAWQRLDGAGYVNRIKMRLADLDWATLRAAEGAVLEADASGRGPGGARTPVAWRITER